MTAAASTMSGKGAAKAKMATKARRAMARRVALRSVRLPMRTTASSTMASTAALRPTKAAATGPSWP